MTDSGLILMADDDEDFAFLMRLAFQRAGIRNPLLAVHNGVELIDYLQGVHEIPGGPENRMPVLIFLDVHLRLLTGYQVLEWIRLQPKFRNLPVVILTGSEVESQDDRVRKLGAQGYHPKPFSMDSLVDFVEEMHGRFIDKRHAMGVQAA